MPMLRTALPMCPGEPDPEIVRDYRRRYGALPLPASVARLRGAVSTRSPVHYSNHQD